METMIILPPMTLAATVAAALVDVAGVAAAPD